MGFTGGENRGGKHTARAMRRRGPEEATQTDADATVRLVLGEPGMGERLRKLGHVSERGVVEPVPVDLVPQPGTEQTRIPRPPDAVPGLGQRALDEQMQGMREWLRGRDVANPVPPQRPPGIG